MSELIERAAAFAKAAHESIDQRRKYTNEPYIVHPQAVAGLVESVTTDEVMIAAAWLHDVVEDTSVTIEEVEADFGQDVASLVDDLTDVAQPIDGNRAARTAKNRDHTAVADPRAKTVKLADVIHNISDIAQANPGYAPKYIAEKEQLIEVLGDGDPALFNQAKQTIAEAKKYLEKRAQ